MQTVPYLRKLHQSADRARLLLVVVLLLLLYALQHIDVHVRDIRFLLLHFLGHFCFNFGRHLV